MVGTRTFTGTWKPKCKDPLDKEIVTRRPDVFLQDKGNRQLYVSEMAVAWDSLQVERRAEKLSKYRDLCADLRRQFPGYRLDVVPVMIGVLGTVTHLGRLPTMAKTESQIKGMQRSVLCSSVRIPRSHLSTSELAAWADVESAIGHRPARTTSLPA